jgi:hypothetical protein
MNAPVGKLPRCAIYTRKSTDEGLEQSFNGLDARREAYAAYILSQTHEGWEAVTERYDDGGWSGGTMERLALRQLLDDVKAGKIDIIVVYKVDRLTPARHVRVRLNYPVSIPDSQKIRPLRHWGNLSSYRDCQCVSRRRARGRPA